MLAAKNFEDKTNRKRRYSAARKRKSGTAVKWKPPVRGPLPNRKPDAGQRKKRLVVEHLKKSSGEGRPQRRRGEELPLKNKCGANEKPMRPNSDTPNNRQPGNSSNAQRNNADEQRNRRLLQNIDNVKKLDEKSNSGRLRPLAHILSIKHTNTTMNNNSSSNTIHSNNGSNNLRSSIVRLRSNIKQELDHLHLSSSRGNILEPITNMPKWPVNRRMMDKLQLRKSSTAF